MGIDFDDSQRHVLAGEVGARRVVVAGPGAGKTATSVALIRQIDAEHSLPGGSQILFVSFSRAAVKAALEAFGDGSAEYRGTVSAMTLDSLAWQLTGADCRPDGPSASDFDDTVRLAVKQLESEYDGEFDEVIHLIVDEAQDLSRDRRDLLCAVIDRLPEDAGVTIFGDPLQAIYDFLDGDVKSAQSSWDALLKDLRKRSITETLTLDGEYRARRRGPRKVATAVPELRSTSKPRRADLLDEVVSDLTHLNLSEFADKVPTWPGRTAVLARTNAEVAFLFDKLSREGLSCTLNENRRRRRLVNPWVAQLWASAAGTPITRDDFQAFVEAHSDVDEGAFRLMLHATESGSSIRWRDVARLLARGDAEPGPWFQEARKPIEVSTIHQAKGLEFENVAVVGAASMLRPPHAGFEPETELLFVALSRARDRVVVLDWDAPFSKVSPSSGLLYEPHPVREVATTVCISPGHLRGDLQVGSAAGQQALAEYRPGQLLEFELLSSAGGEWPSYRCRLAGETVGATTSEFGIVLADVLRVGGRTNRWPSLGQVPMDGIETAWADRGDALSFWLKPRPFGFLAVNWGR